MNYPILDGGLTPVQFKTLFKPQEYIAIKALKATDPMVDYFFDILDDPRCTKIEMFASSTKDALLYFVGLSILDESRVSEILQAQVP